MDKKLYQVTITVCVLAESEDDACDVARENVGDLGSNEFMDAIEIEGEGDIPPLWDSEIPIGSDEDITCAEYARGVSNNEDEE